MIAPNPFPGLRPFRESESACYFGQDVPIEELLARLGRSQFLAVIGVSGTGKSSLVRAGLIAELRKFGTLDRPRWHIAVCRPGIDPVGNLAKALEALELPRKIKALPYLRRSARGIIDYADAAGIQSDQRLLVVADQFEELFRYRRADPSVKGQDNAALFVRLLLEAAGENTNGYAAITMRADFLGDCSLFYGLAEKINEGIYLVPKIERRQLREMIEEPIRRAGRSISPVLVERLLGESEEREDGLPLLQHTLMRIWNHWAARGQPDSSIDEQDFDVPSPQGINRPLIEYHVDLHLDSIYTELSPEGKLLAERMFKLLSERDPRGREVRRGVLLEDLAATMKKAPEKKTASEKKKTAYEEKIALETLLTVIDSFRDESKGRTFLMPPKGEGSPSDPIDISHECLLRQWTKLRDWVKDEARDAAQFQRLADRADGGAGEPLRGRDLDSYWDWWQRAKPTPEWASRYETPADAGLNTRPRTYQAAKDYLFASRNARLRRHGMIAVLVALLVGAGCWQLGQTLASKDKTISQKEAALSSQNDALSHLSINLTQVAEGSTRNNTELEKEALAAIARYAQTASVQTGNVDSGLPAAVGTTPRIYPQYWTDVQKNSLQQIAAKLSESGLIMAPPQKVSVGPSDTELRYFHQEQAGEAGKIVAALKSAGVNAKPVYIAGFDKVAANQFELWFARPGDGTR
jgi:hypothetical protein